MSIQSHSCELGKAIAGQLVVSRSLETVQKKPLNSETCGQFNDY
jgi:hypothetical protein